MKRLAGKTVIVTGAAMGMGEATSELFIEHDAHVVLADMNDESSYVNGSEHLVDGGWICGGYAMNKPTPPQ